VISNALSQNIAHPDCMPSPTLPMPADNALFLLKYNLNYSQEHIILHWASAHLLDEVELLLKLTGRLLQYSRY